MKGRQELRRSIKKDVATAEDSETDTGADMQSSQDILRTGQTVHHRRKRQIAYARRRISNRDRWSFVLLKFAVSDEIRLKPDAILAQLAAFYRARCLNRCCFQSINFFAENQVDADGCDSG
ncbi:hypothetical protein VTP01DRAFT_7904 [Rhizomucor pusillus]|uniref:uncharacterized protein n=1 Tax=Rhizomucor pusillus TaxID=4840 RepID=UPI00374345FF